jgi:hypothetical protein
MKLTEDIGKLCVIDCKCIRDGFIDIVVLLYFGKGFRGEEGEFIKVTTLVKKL